MVTHKTPQDHAAKAKKSGPSEPFCFTHNGQEYQMQPGDTMNIGFARRIRHLSQEAQIFEMIEALAPDDETLAAIDDMHAAEFLEFQRDWQAHSRITPGE